MANPLKTTPRFERVADGLLTVVKERGVEATTVEAIVAAADVPREEFDALFAGRQDCVDQVWERMAADFRRELRDAFDGERPWRERLRAAAHCALDYFQADAARSALFMAGILSGAAVTQERRYRLVELGVELVDEGRQELADPKSMSRATAEGVAGAIFETAVGAAIKGDAAMAEGLLPQLMFLAVLPYLGREAALEELRREVG